MVFKKNKNTTEKTYWAYVKRQFVKNKRALYAAYIVFFLAIIALFADFLANDKPIIMKYQGTWYSPILKEYVVEMGMGEWSENLNNPDWKNLEMDFALFPPIPYKPDGLDANANFISPFDEQNVPSWQWRHWLGTDNLGKDVFAGMIHGTRIAFLVGIISMGLAAGIGVFLGALGGFFGDDLLKSSRIRMILNILFLPFAFFYGFSTRSYVLSDAFKAGFWGGMWELTLSIFLFLTVIAVANLLVIPLKKVPFFRKKINLPLDSLLTRLIEVVVSVPVLILILAVVAVAKPSIYNVMIVIGLVSWTGIARFIRAELLKIRKLEYIEAAQALGFSNWRIMFRHAVPNALSPVFIAIAFGIASAILVESFLSFLGFGVPATDITWGKLLAISRTNAGAWWLAVFPGLAIFFTVTLFNLIGEGLTDALDPRLKN